MALGEAYNPPRNPQIILDQAGIQLTTCRLKQHYQLPVVQHLVQDCVNDCVNKQSLNDRAQVALHDNIIKWKHFPRYWPFVWGIHRSPVNSPMWIFYVFFEGGGVYWFHSVHPSVCPFKWSMMYDHSHSRWSFLLKWLTIPYVVCKLTT